MNIRNQLLRAVLITLLSANSDAALVIAFSQDGDDVLVTARGTVNVSGLGAPSKFGGDGTPRSRMQNADEFDHAWSGIVAGDDIYLLGASASLYSMNTPPTEIDIGTFSGDSFGIGTSSSGFSLYFADGFTGGDFNGDLRIPDITLSTYQPRGFRFTWGPAESQSLIVVPEPSPVFLVAIGGGLLLAMKRRQKWCEQDEDDQAAAAVQSKP